MVNNSNCCKYLKNKYNMKFILVIALFIAVGESTEALVCYEEFHNAVTVNNYPAPSEEQYNAFHGSLESKAGIDTKEEAAMALTHFLWESDGLKAKREYGCCRNGCAGKYETPGCDVPGQHYYGRGYIQLTWCYNYKQASIDLYGNEWMIHDADGVARDESVAWDTAFWFWKNNVHSEKGVVAGMFGVTTKAINGDQECGLNTTRARHRFQMYKKVREAFGLVGEGDERGCYN